AVGWWRATLALLFGTPVAVLAVLGFQIPPARFWLLLPAVIIALAGAPLTLVLPRWWYRLHRWEVTDAAVYTRSGYFWQEWRGPAAGPPVASAGPVRATGGAGIVSSCGPGP